MSDQDKKEEVPVAEPAAEEQPAATEEVQAEAPAAEGEAAQAEAPKEEAPKVETSAPQKEAAPGEEPESPDVRRPVVEEEDDADKMELDQYYPEDHVDKPLIDSPISTRNIAFEAVLGQNSYKRYNIHFLMDDVIIYVCGNRYQIFNLTTHECHTYAGQDTDGVGSIAVHPNRKFFAVAEKGRSPNIYIREYPSLRLYRILRKGTEMLYAHVEFSQSGEKLVSLGGAPDYTITVWNWINQKVILKCKAWGQEVFRASFSPYSENVLTTAGQGHIKFWKMATTFTGLKLQGEGGKFGGLDRSDTSAYYELPDGKFISGTEAGNLILWEGVLVKAHLVLDRDTKAPLHKGMIEVVLYEDKNFITAGADGYIKWWPLADIDQAEGDEAPEVAIRPLKEVSISTPEGDYAHIVNMVKGKGMWLVQDAKGRLWQLDAKDYQATVVREFHQGAITDLAVSDSFNMCITTGENGLVKVWDYLRQVPLYQVQYKGRANCIDLLRRSDVNKGRIAAIGYDTGVIRIVGLGETKVEMASVFKAADTGIVKCKYCPAQSMMVTASEAGELFFFEVNGFSDLSLYNPICLVRLPQKGGVGGDADTFGPQRITDLKWDNTSSKIIVTTQQGYVYEINKPNPLDVDNKESYEAENYPMKEWRITMMEFQMKKNQAKDPEEEEKKRRMRLRGELPAEDEEEEEDWDPEEIVGVVYMNDESGRFLISSVGQYAGYIYMCKFGERRPSDAFEIPKDAQITFMQFSNFGELLIVGFNNGEVRVHLVEYMKNFLSIKQHDLTNGSITAAHLNFNEQFLITTGRDGLVFVHAIDKYMIQQEAKFEPLQGVEGIDFMPKEQVKAITAEKVNNFKEENPSNIPEVDAKIDGVDDTAFAVTLRIPEEPEDIVDDALYSIQTAKLRTEEDMRMKLAEEKKDGVRSQIGNLRTQFKSLTDKNQSVEDAIQVDDEDFNIERDYFNDLTDKVNAKIEETKKEVAYDIEWATVALNKLKDKFYSVLHFEKFTVKALRTHSYVTTFRVPRMSEFLTQNLESFKQLLGAENGNRDSMDFEDEDVNMNLGDGEDERKGTDLQRKAIIQQPEKKVHKTEAEKKREERKVERERRKKEIENLEKLKTNKSQQDPAEKAKILEAQTSFGMYSLKRHDDYQVPESQQTNYTKKRQQMVLLEASIYKLKMDFNTKIQELKLRKKEILTRVEVLYTRIGAINEELATPEELIVPQIDEAVEYPQKFFEVNDKDIDDFKQVQQQRELEKAKTGAKKATGSKKAKEEKAAEEAKQKAQVEEERKKREAAAAGGADGGASDAHPYKRTVIERKGRKPQDSPCASEFDEVRRIELKFEREQLMNEVNKLIDDFDEEIREMQKEKYRLESDLKNAELKLILLFEELILLESMEHRDQDLMAALGQCKQRSDMISTSIKEITTDLAKKTKEIDDIREKQEVLMAKFYDLCPQEHENHNAVMQFFEKRTKKRRKAEKRPDKDEEDEEDEDGEGEEEQEDFEDEEDSDGDEEDNLQALADGDLKIDQIESLREEKLDLHDAGEKILAHMHQLEARRKKLDTESKKIKLNMDETMEEIADFQKEKMAKMNELLVSVVLKVRQIQNLEEQPKKTAEWHKRREQEEQDRMNAMRDGDASHDEGDEFDGLNRTMNKLDEIDYRGFFLPDNCLRCVLFTRNQLLQLIERQKELADEVDDLKKKKADAIVNETKVKRENRTKDKQVEERKREYEERQMLRFGNLVDLDSLEVSGPSAVVLELQRRFQKTEQQSVRSIEDELGRLQATQRALTESIRRNTGLLDMIRNMADMQEAKNKELTDTNKQIFQDDDNEEKRKMSQLKQKFKAKLEEQARKIDNIKMEINLYKRKGGHIYTKVTTNRRTNQQGDQ